MKYHYYAVAYQRDPNEFCYLTMFARIGHIWCALPSGKDGFRDTEHYNFKRLTLAEYETHIALNTMEIRDSDTFVVFSEQFEMPDGS